VPEELEADTYELRIITQFAKGKTPLKNARSIIFDLPIVIL
jgi:hypothetical protein